MRLKGKAAVISGGASGIGAASARRFVEEGARVVIGDLNAEKGEALARELGEAARFIRLDVREEADWAAAIALAQERFGSVTTVVNAAGVSRPATIEDETLAAFREQVAINLDGTFLGCKHGVAAMKGGRGGSIVNFGSTLGVRAGAIFTAYAASKGGVRLLTRAVALHCADAGYDIRCNAVLPGAIHTEMVEGYVAAGEARGVPRQDTLERFASVHPMKRLGLPREGADAVVFLASEESSFTTGADLPVDGGYLA